MKKSFEKFVCVCCVNVVISKAPQHFVGLYLLSINCVINKLDAAMDPIIRLSSAPSSRWSTSDALMSTDGFSASGLLHQ